MKDGKATDKPATIPNEVPVRRWVAFFFAAYAAAIVAQVPASVINNLWTERGAWSWLPDTLTTLGGFAFSFLFAVLLLRLICKTSLHDLILGYKGKVDWAQCGKVAGAILAGCLLTTLFLTDWSNVTLNGIGALPILVSFLLCLALVWMQTTWEEIVFRCTFLRASCGNKIRASVPCVVWGVVSSALFTLVHVFNPEVTSQTDVLDLAAGIASYFIAGFMMYFVNVVYRSCLPSCIVHWVNNFLGLAVITQTGSAVETGAIFVEHSAQNGTVNLWVSLLTYFPLAVLLIVEVVRNRKKAENAGAGAGTEVGPTSTAA